VAAGIPRDKRAVADRRLFVSQSTVDYHDGGPAVRMPGEVDLNELSGELRPALASERSEDATAAACAA
jgi:hypothetical protein